MDSLQLKNKIIQRIIEIDDVKKKRNILILKTRKMRDKTFFNIFL